MIKALVFDWGNTIMRDFPEKKGPMWEWDQVEYIPFAEESLKVLHNEFSMCIASNAGCSDTAQMIKALKRVGAEIYFNHFFTSKEIGYEKPHIEFFLAIFNKLYVAPSECVMIGDNYVKDICGAKDAGMKTVFYNASNDLGKFIKADKIITSLKFLPNTIKELNL